jgi:hypothetical protein
VLLSESCAGIEFRVEIVTGGYGDLLGQGAIVCPPRPVLRVLRLDSLERSVPVHDTLDDALARGRVPAV